MLQHAPIHSRHSSQILGCLFFFCVVHGTGSLGTSVFDTDVYLVGASGGVYALLAAHLANVLLVSQPAQSLSHRNNFVFLSFSQWS